MFQGLNRSRRPSNNMTSKEAGSPCLPDPDRNSGTKQPQWTGYFTTNKPQTTIVPTVTRQDTTFKIRSFPLVFATSCVSDLAITTARSWPRPGVDQNSRRPKRTVVEKLGEGSSACLQTLRFGSSHRSGRCIAGPSLSSSRPEGDITH
jgi:hypothetical protein